MRRYGMYGGRGEGCRAQKVANTTMIANATITAVTCINSRFLFAASTGSMVSTSTGCFRSGIVIMFVMVFR